MKRLKYAVILLLGLSMATMMTSCNKESSYQDQIVGEWRWTKRVNYNYDTTGALVYEDVYDFLENDEEYEWKFYSDGKVVMPSWYWQKSDGECVVDYVIEGSTLLLGGHLAAEQDTYTIQELTNSTLVLEREYSVNGYWNYEEQCYHEGQYRRVYSLEFNKVN